MRIELTARDMADAVAFHLIRLGYPQEVAEKSTVFFEAERSWVFGKAVFKAIVNIPDQNKRLS